MIYAARTDKYHLTTKFIILIDTHKIGSTLEISPKLNISLLAQTLYRVAFF
jgi:hypothetical protein